jgi:hypothetical protein
MHVAASTMAHDDMGDMAMGSTESMEPMEEPAANPDPDAIALGQPVGPCPHCAVHSRTTPNTVSLRDAEILKRSGSFVIPDTVSPVVSVEMPFAVSLTSRAHGPPGTSTPRHVLINIFRI